MEVLECGHVAHEASGLLCVHLMGYAAADMPSVFRMLRGRGLDCDLVCRRCHDDIAAGTPPKLVVACEGCLERVESDAFPDDFLGWVGSPGIGVRSEPLIVVPIDGLGPYDLASDRAVAAFVDGWVTLSSGGEIRTHAGGLTSGAGHTADDLHESGGRRRKPPVLAVHASDDGRFVAIVNDYGTTGVVMSLETGRTLMQLDRGVYHTRQTRFPCAFTRSPQGEVVLLAGTDWNRVDAFDPVSGRLLTEREFSRDPPRHDPGFFHGALDPAPGGRWVLDDGWVWSPVGMPRAWSVERWLTQNVWEAEEGHTGNKLGYRICLWDAPMCWLNDRLVAIWGLGSDDEAMLDGVIVYDIEDHINDAEDMIRVSEFAGVPKGRLWSDGQRLFAVGPDGMSVWDPFTGERTAELPATRPIAFNRWLDEFLVEESGDLRRIRLAPRPARRGHDGHPAGVPPVVGPAV